MLTMKQEKFVQGIINGMSQREAYKNAYSAKNMSDNAIDREASLLMKNPKISQRHKELVDAMAKHSIMTAQERMEYCTKVLLGEIKEKAVVVVNDEAVVVDAPANLATKAKYLEILNKMSGEYVTKIDADVKVKKLEDLL